MTVHIDNVRSLVFSLDFFVASCALRSILPQASRLCGAQPLTQASRESFVRLAEKRTRKAIKDIRLIGNLSNRSNYSYADKDVAKIFGALEQELRAARNRFIDALAGSKDIDFTL